MKKCKHCQSEIDKKAKVCPNCRKKQKSPIMTILIVLVVLTVIGAITSSGNSETNKDKKNDEEKFSYTVTSSAPDEANFAYYIEGVVTNNKDKDYSYVQIEFVCYNAEGNNLGTAVANVNNLSGKETWKYKAIGLFTNQVVDHCDFKEITAY